MLNKVLLNSNTLSLFQSESGRYIYRHSNNLGTTIEFDMYGTWTKLFVPDAKYRPLSKVPWSNSYTDISAITNISLPINISGYYITGSSYSHSKILDPIPTDDELQSTLPLSSIQSAKTCTDAMISSIGSSTSYAAGLARSCYISGLGYMDLPNIYELMVIWCEADNIDDLDPTAENYPDAKLGYTATDGRFGYASGIWSSSEKNAESSWCINWYGQIEDGYKYYSNNLNVLTVCAVKEL